MSARQEAVCVKQPCEQTSMKRKKSRESVGGEKHMTSGREWVKGQCMADNHCFFFFFCFLCFSWQYFFFMLIQ